MIAPDVSVIIPAWKAAGFISKAIASALSSSGVGLEVVAVDDASPDHTFETLQKLAVSEPRLKTARLSANGGPSAARNRAIELSSGRFIAILDADDTITPDRLARLLELAETRQADIILDNMIEVDADGARIGSDNFLNSAEFASDRAIDLATWVKFNQPMRQCDCLGYLKPLIRRQALERTGVRYDPALRNSEDYYLIADLLAAGCSMAFTPVAGYAYRRADSSTSHRLTPAQTSAWLVAEADFRRRWEAKLSLEERTLLDARGRLLKDVDQFVSAMGLVKAKRFGAFASLLASDPRAAAFTLTSFAKIAVEKTTGRKAF